jgi:multiple sugar transport system ATP-binding protein
MASIRLERVYKRYGPVEAVTNLSLVCADGELLGLLGPSGCGKTSTLKMIAGIEDISDGEIYFGDLPVSPLDPAERNVAMVFEDYALYPHLTVADNVAFPLEIRHRPRSEIRRAVEETLALLGLQALRDAGVRQLSGGAQQRVAIGRALVRQPAVVLFDEPLSHLDGDHKVQLRAEIKRLQKEAGVTAVLVTHDQAEAMAMADRVAVMDRGVLQQLGSPQELYEDPANLLVAQFIGEPPMNLLAGRLEEDTRSPATLAVAGDGWRVRLSARVAAQLRETADARQVVMGVRPEHLRLQATDGTLTLGRLTGHVFLREPRGEVDVVLVRLDRPVAWREERLTRDVITLEVAAGVECKEGDAVGIAFPEAGLHLFDPESGRNLLAIPRSD